MSNDQPLHPFMTTADAAAYCGFKTTGGIRKAKHDGKIKPIGRRGGSGPWMWSRDELDRFLRGEPPATINSDRPGAPPIDGDARNGQEVDQALEKMGCTDQGAGSLATEGRRFSGSRPRHGSDDGPAEGDQEGADGRRRSNSVQVAARPEGTRQGWPRRGRATEDALRRLRGLVARAEDQARPDQERQGQGAVEVHARASDRRNQG
ncbi:MAG: helix-turn-helix domain-containing protein [Deltaproteobacteria bacterium]|nr:helix-turn-helix domain-containing protein [Deltaproteobacteria bacterium]